MSRRHSEHENKRDVIAGNGWAVIVNNAGEHGVYPASNDDNESALLACRRCAQQAVAGSPDAIAAIMMCHYDGILQRYFREEVELLGG